MRTHLQGTFLLIVLLLVFWWALSWAVPVLDSAVFGEDGAIVARARPEVDDPADADRAREQNLPLDGNEVAELQGALTQLGFNPGPIDGIMGELTRQAVGEAKTDLGLAEASDRRLLETLSAALEALSSASNSDTPGP
ncbi:MAG: peptidoglycan-binding domain-containing protein [Acidimicrobiaceae bacterium]|nr:peptidoglycan-binding domain-containing protein [Acidimicrobiaceae bacterium]